MWFMLKSQEARAVARSALGLPEASPAPWAAASPLPRKVCLECAVSIHCADCRGTRLVAWGDAQRNPICTATPSSGTLSLPGCCVTDEKEDTAQKPAARPSGSGLNRTSVAAPVSRREDLDAAENPSLKVCCPSRTCGRAEAGGLEEVRRHTLLFMSIKRAWPLHVPFIIC